MRCQATVALVVLASCMSSLVSASQAIPELEVCSNYPAARDPPKTSPMLKFSEIGEFKILQIADAHYINEDSPCRNILPSQEPCSGANSTEWMSQILEREKPDLVVFTGDNVWFEGNKDIVGSQNRLTHPVNEAKIPYMMTYGNHDCEGGDKNCRAILMAADQKNLYSLSEPGPEEVTGTGNYAYTVSGSDGRPAFSIWVFDGGDYNTDTEDPHDYDYIRHDQVQWYKDTSMALELEVKKRVPGVAFFHIPLAEYHEAWACSNPDAESAKGGETGGAECRSGPIRDPDVCSSNLKGAAAGSLMSLGQKQERVCSPVADGGLMSSFIERGDVKMTNVGHDHINDYCASLHDIRLCFGGAVGCAIAERQTGRRAGCRSNPSTTFAHIPTPLIASDLRDCGPSLPLQL